MQIEITHVRFNNSSRSSQAISAYKWTDLADASNTGETLKPQMVQWLDLPANYAYVGCGSTRADVAVVRSDYADPYLRSYADKEWNNNLENLPVF